MGKGRKYKTEKERRDAIKYSSRRNMAREMTLKTERRTVTKKIRGNSLFTLTLLKKSKVYQLENHKNGKTIELTREQVQEMELAMVRNEVFNSKANQLF